MTDGTPEETSQAQAYTVRLELVDEPGALLDALRPIADHGGNLLSILHERGNVTPRGRIPVEIDLEIHPERFDDLVEALRTAGVNVVEAGEERYSEELTVLLSGPLVATDLSDTISELEAESNVAVTDISLSALEATSVAIATLGNIGPGFGFLGPFGSYLDFPATSKLLMIFLMWIGRLEIIPVFVMFTGAFWNE